MRRPRQNYIEIVRHFREPENDPTSAVSSRMRRAMELEPKSKDWNALLPVGSILPVVLVAPSRTGKTLELQNEARRLRAANRFAVYASAPDIVDGFLDGLDQVELKEFERWEKTPEPLELFIDAVDELHLRSRTFQNLLRTLDRKIDMSTRRVRLIISSRTGTWTPGSTQQLADFARLDEDQKPQVVTFDPLDDLALGQLATAAGVSDVDEFLGALDSEEVSSLWELCPEDIEPLALMWKADRKFGKWRELLIDRVDRSTYEAEPGRARDRQLPTAATQEGLQRIAAAMLLAKLPQVSGPFVASVATAISSRRLFNDWTSAAVIELFENHLLVHKGKDAEAAQLPVGPLYYFLAASWLAKRVQHGQDVETIRDVLLVRIYDEDHYRIPTLHQAVVGWLASELPAFRKLLLDVHPAVALFEGDPDSLTDHEIRASLRVLCERLAGRATDPGLPTPATLRKLARPSVESDVHTLLVTYRRKLTYSQHLSTIFAHLLRIAIAGRYSSCVEVALNVMLDNQRSPDLRCLAIRLVSAAGSEKQRNSLAKLIPDTQMEIRQTLLDALVSNGFAGPDLVALICRGGDVALQVQLRRVADRIALPDVQAAVANLTEGLTGEIIDARTENALRLLPQLLATWVRRQSEPSEALLHSLITVERRVGLMGAYSAASYDLAAAAKEVQAQSPLFKTLWDARIVAASQDPMNDVLLAKPAFGGPRPEDLDWLYPRLSVEHRALVIDPTWLKISEDGRKAIRETASEDLSSYLDAIDAREASYELEKQRRERLRLEARGQTRARNRELLEPRREAIASGDDIGALINAWEDVAAAPSGRVDLDLNRLRQRVGEDLVEVFRRGFVASWRKQTAELPKPGSNSYFLRFSIGLTGIDIEARAGLDFSRLTSFEAENAACYAFYELNGFPFWFDDLLRAHPAAVRAVLQAAISADWCHKGKTLGVLRFAPRSSSEVAALLSNLTFELPKKFTSS